MKKKQKELMTLLIQAKGSFKTSAQFAAELSLSDRTVRTYLQNLKTLLAEHGGDILAKQGAGYQLHVQDRQQFHRFLTESKLLDLSAMPQRLHESSERKRYLLNLLLLKEQRLDVDDLSDQLYISVSQLNKDIAEIKQQLMTYDLRLIKQKQICFVEGTEQAKRHFIINYFFNKESITVLQQLTHTNVLSDRIPVDLLAIIIIDECRGASLKISDIMLQNLVLHLSLSVKRLASGFEIQALGTSESMHHSAEYCVAQNILNRIESSTGLRFPATECDYLTMHLMTKSNSGPLDSDADLQQSLQALLLKMQLEMGYDFISDHALQNGLIAHLKPMLIRLKRQIALHNPLLKEIQENYLPTFHMIKKTMAQLPELKPYTVSDDEWAYVTLHFLASMEKYKNRQKIKVLIICATGYGSAQLLKTRVEAVFGGQFNIVATKGYYEITSDLLDQVDLILSSIDLSSHIFKIPVFHVSVFLTETEIQTIWRYLNQSPMSSSRSLAVTALTDQKAQMMQKMDDFSADYFYYCAAPISKEQVITTLLERLATHESADYSEKMVQQMARRAELGGVLFSDTIAVPHPAMALGKLPKVGIAVIPHGVYWNAQYPNIRFIFLISPSMYHNDGLTWMTQAIVTLIDASEVQERLLTCQDFTAFKTEFISLIRS